MRPHTSQTTTEDTRYSGEQALSPSDTPRSTNSKVLKLDHEAATVAHVWSHGYWPRAPRSPEPTCIGPPSPFHSPPNDRHHTANAGVFGTLLLVPGQHFTVS